MKEADKQIIYYYRNGFRAKDIADRLGMTVPQIKYRIQRLRGKGMLKRWWKEGEA